MQIGRCLDKLQILVMAGMLIQFACGGNGSAGGGGNQAITPASPVSVILIGAPADINVGDTLPVTAQVLGSTNPAVIWKVDDIPNGNSDVGTITGSGNTVTYVAPATEGMHVLASTSVLDPTKSASGQLRIHHSSISSVTVAPTTWTLNVGDQKQFAATVTGSGNYSSAVTWSAQRGTITSTGLYTAPSTSGSDVVTAKSVQDTTKTRTASITVNTINPTISSVTVSPASLALNVSAQNQLTATIAGTGSYNSAVTWSAQRGAVTSTGLYTAPSTSGSDVVTATSVQDTSKTGTASITVNTINPSISSVTVSPATLALNVSAQNQFAATVAGTGSYNSAVTWSAQRGTITSTGLYTSPSTSGSDVVTATSVQDTSKSAASSITVILQAPVVVAPVSPSNPIKTVNKTGVVFASSVTGSSNTAITWSVSGGTITAGQGTSSMTWAAPAVASTVTITATSQADSSKSASTTVTVVPVASASLSANTTTPTYGSTSVAITPVFTGASTAVVGTTQGGNDISTSPTTGTAISVPMAFTPSVSNVTQTSFTQSVSASGVYPQSVTSTASTSLVSIMTGFRAASGSGAYVRSAVSSSIGQLAGVPVVAGDLIVVTALRGASLTSVTVSDNAVGGSNTYMQVGSGIAETVHSNSGYQFYAVAKNTETLMITDSLFGASWDYGFLVHVISNANGVVTSVLDGKSLVADTAEQTAHANSGPTTLNSSDLILAAWMDGAYGSTITQTASGFTTTQTYWLRATNAAGDYVDSSITITPVNPVNSTISAVAVSPTTLSLNVSAQNQFTATVTGTGSYSSAVTWSAQRGTITSTGLYTAPSTSGSDVVTTKSVQDTTKTATASITVNSVITGTSVKTYGAKGDGVTDDTAAIQACINAVAGTGGTVVVPDGTYMINATQGSGVWGLMMGSNMTFAMTSGATLKAITNSSTDYGILCSNGAGNFTITGGNIVGERSTHTGSGGESGMGIYLNAANVTVTGVNISECWGDGIYICDASSNITITNCISNHNRRQGLSITAGNTFLISGCTFSNTTGTDPQCGIDIEPNGSVPVTGVHITNCQIFGNAGGGVQQGNVGNVASGTLLENCNIYGNGGSGYHDGGIRFVETHDNTIRNNNVHNNSDGGIMLDTNAGIGCPNTTVTGNTVTNNTGWGITAALCNGSVITGNTITGNSGTAFSYGGSSGTYSPNTIN